MDGNKWTRLWIVLLFKHAVKKIWRSKAWLRSLWVPYSQPPHIANYPQSKWLENWKGLSSRQIYFKASGDLKTAPPPNTHTQTAQTLKAVLIAPWFLLQARQTGPCLRSSCETECGFCQLPNDPHEILQSYEIWAGVPSAWPDWDRDGSENSRPLHFQGEEARQRSYSPACMSCSYNKAEPRTTEKGSLEQNAA